MQWVVWCSWKSSIVLDRKVIYSLVWLEMWYCALHLCWAAFTTTHVKHAPLDPRSFLQKKCQVESFSWRIPKSDVPSCLDVRVVGTSRTLTFRCLTHLSFVQTRPVFAVFASMKLEQNGVQCWYCWFSNLESETPEKSLHAKIQISFSRNARILYCKYTYCNSWSLVHGSGLITTRQDYDEVQTSRQRKRVLTRGPMTSWCLRHVARGRWSVETPGNKASCNMM